MRKVIAKQEKTAIALVTALAVFSLPGSIMMLRHPMAAGENNFAFCFVSNNLCEE